MGQNNPTVAEAAKLLGGSEAWVRSLCSRSIIGDAWRSTWEFQHHMTGHRMKYEVVPSKLAQFMQITEDELYWRLADLRKRGNDGISSLYR